MHIAFGDVEPSQAERLFLHFFEDSVECGEDKENLSDLAREFVDNIFPNGRKDREDLSMAELQGYLLQKRDDPRLAAAGAGFWADEHLNSLAREKKARRAALIGEELEKNEVETDGPDVSMEEIQRRHRVQGEQLDYSIAQMQRKQKEEMERLVELNRENSEQFEDLAESEEM